MLVIVLFVVICTLGLSSSLDPDFGWHLYLAKQTHQSGHLIQTLVGYWSFPKYRLIDQEWLTHYLLGFYNVNGWGYTGLVLLVAVIAFFTYWSAYLGLIRIGYSKKVALFVTSLIMLPLTIVYGVRVQILLLIGVSLLWYVVPAVKNLTWRRISYFLIFALGTNLHGGYLLLITIPLCTESYPFVDSLKKDFRSKESKKEAWTYLTTIIIASLGLLTSPYGLSYWQLVLSYGTERFYQSHIQEWMPIFVYSPFQYLEISLPLTISLILLMFRAKNRPKIPLPYLLLLLLWLYIGVRYVRFYPILLLLAGPLLADSCETTLSNNDFKHLTPKAKNTFLYGWILVVALVMAFESNDFNLHPMGWPLDPAKAYGYPSGALNFISTNYSQQCQGHLLNSYGWGGYILGFSNQQVFIDGRGPQLKLSNGNTLLQEYFNTYNPSLLPGIVNSFNIKCVLAEKPSPPTNKNISFLAQPLQTFKSTQGEQVWINYFGLQDNWKVVYSDKTSEVFVKKGS